MPVFILNYLSILTLWKGAIENTAQFMAVLLGLRDNWSTYYAGWRLQCSLDALNLMLNGKSHSLEILITRQSFYIFACTKQKIYTDICLTSCCPLHTHLLLTKQLQLLLHLHKAEQQSSQGHWAMVMALLEGPGKKSVLSARITRSITAQISLLLFNAFGKLRQLLPC